jgi:hypothetical protein
MYRICLLYIFYCFFLLYRLPVVSPALNPVEAAMMEMLRQVELEDSMLSDHEVRHKSVFNVIFCPFSSCLLKGKKSPFRIIFTVCTVPSYHLC